MAVVYNRSDEFDGTDCDDDDEIDDDGDDASSSGDALFLTACEDLSNSTFGLLPFFLVH